MDRFYSWLERLPLLLQIIVVGFLIISALVVGFFLGIATGLQFM